MKPWNEIHKAATAFSKRWKDAYDAKSRRVRKVTPDVTTTFFFNYWNIIEERVAYTNGTSTTIRYHWGKDLSGTLHGAGGVGGLLYLTVSNSSTPNSPTPNSPTPPSSSPPQDKRGNADKEIGNASLA